MYARLPRLGSRFVPALAIAAATASAGCFPAATGVQPPDATNATVRKSPAPTRGVASPGASAAALPSLAPAGIVTLTGKVKLISDRGGAIIGDNGAGIISNNGGTIISDNGGGVVSNNGATYTLQAKVAEALLADAVIRFEDAAGKPVAGPDGKPLTATTDRQGRYALTAALPAGNVVMKVALWDGGELAALLARKGEGATQDVDTASSLGAAFVLERLVKGDQATLDKLPAAEAGRLQVELEAARELLPTAPTYRPVPLAAAAADLRGKAATVDQAITAIEALLLGQARLGDGRPATEVPLNRPTAVVVDRAGGLMIAEYGMGRVRVVGKDGRMRTLADAARGTIKSNFLYVNDLVEAPDGTLYLVTNGDRSVHRVAPDGTIGVFYAEPPPRAVKPQALALGQDGTLYVGGGDDDAAPSSAKLVAIAPDGTPRTLTPPDGPGKIRALATAPDGTLFVLRSGDRGNPLGTLDRRDPAGAYTRLAADLRVHDRGDLARAADGTLYVADDRGGAVEVFAPDGGRRTLAGPVGAAALLTPGGIGLAPDGGIYVSDHGTGLVHRRDPDGTWRVIAGVNADTAPSDGRSLPLNTPVAVAFDGQGRLLIAENGRHRVVRFEGGRITTVAGSAKGYGGDGGSALAATFNGIAGLAARGDAIFVLDGANNSLRAIGADGVISTVAGPGGRTYLEGSAPAAEANLVLAIGLAIDPTGRPYWSNTGRHQVQRLTAPGTAALVAGRRPRAGERDDLAALLASEIVDGEAARTSTIRFPLGLAFDAGGDLIVADAGHSLIRKISGLGGDDPRITTVAGIGPAGMAALPTTGEVPATGKALELPLITPAGVCVDAAGNVYVGELGTTRTELMADIFSESASLDLSAFPPVHPRVRKIAPDGAVTTIAGPGGTFFTDPFADDALIMPSSLAIAPDGRLVIADPGANLVRILPAGSF